MRWLRKHPGSGTNCSNAEKPTPRGIFAPLSLSRTRHHLHAACDSDDYRLDFGRADQVVDRSERGSGFPSLPIHLWRNVPLVARDRSHDERAREASIDLPVDPGGDAVLKFTDAAGKPLAGVQTNGLRFAGPRSARKQRPVVCRRRFDDSLCRLSGRKPRHLAPP